MKLKELDIGEKFTYYKTPGVFEKVKEERGYAIVVGVVPPYERFAIPEYMEINPYEV